jgi:hypothetical protein
LRAVKKAITNPQSIYLNLTHHLPSSQSDAISTVT